MDEDILIAIIAGLLNILFSILIPPLLNKTNIPYTSGIKKHYECNKQYILISTIITVVLVYISLQITPFINSNIFNNLAKLNTVKSVVPQLSEMSPTSSSSPISPAQQLSSQLESVQKLSSQLPSVQQISSQLPSAQPSLSELPSVQQLSSQLQTRTLLPSQPNTNLIVPNRVN